jgi:hypothetical protein
MSTKLLRRPGLPVKLERFHEASTLVTLALVVAHAGLLLADGYLRPGLAGIALPFHLSYRPLWTGTGIIAGWLAMILGLSFYARKWIGAKTWRWLHRWTLAVYVLAVGHAIGSGTDGRSTWMLAMLTVLTARSSPPSPIGCCPPRGAGRLRRPALRARARRGARPCRARQSYIPTARSTGLSLARPVREHDHDQDQQGERPDAKPRVSAEPGPLLECEARRLLSNAEAEARRAHARGARARCRARDVGLQAVELTLRDPGDRDHL